MSPVARNARFFCGEILTFDLSFPGCSGIGTEFPYYPLGWARSACLTMTRLAKANSVCSCAVFFLRPR